MNSVVIAAGLVFLASLVLGGPPVFLPPWTACFFFSLSALARLWLSARRARRSLLDDHPDAFLFWLCLTLYLATFRWHGGDDIPNSMLGFQLWRHGTLAFDEVRAWAAAPGMVDLIHELRGRLLSTYPVAPGVLAAPLYLLPAIFVPSPDAAFLHSLAKISGSVITALSVVIFRRAALRLCSPRWALELALLYGLGSYAFSVSSQALYSHGPAQLGLALGLLGLLNDGAQASALAGFGFALAWASRENSLAFAAAAGAFLLIYERRRLLFFAAGAALPVALNLAYWKYYTGAFHPPYYELQMNLFSRFSFTAAAAMILSPARGLVFFFPLGVLGIWGLWKLARDPQERWAFCFGGACIVVWLAFAMRQSWTGGNSYGERYFAGLCLVLAIACAALEREIRDSPTLRAVWGALFSYCIMIHALGAFFQWPGASATIQEQIRTVWDFRMFPPAQLFLKEGPLRWALFSRVSGAFLLLGSLFFFIRRIERGIAILD